MNALKSLFGLFILVLGVYLGWMCIPAYFANYQFEEEVRTAARDAIYQRLDDEQVKDRIMTKARDLELPLNRESISIVRMGSQLEITAPYQVPVKLPGYKFNLKFSPSTSERRVG